MTTIIIKLELDSQYHHGQTKERTEERLNAMASQHYPWNFKVKIAETLALELAYADIWVAEDGFELDVEDA